jgi:hypothetical protein
LQDFRLFSAFSSALAWWEFPNRTAGKDGVPLQYRQSFD